MTVAVIRFYSVDAEWGELSNFAPYPITLNNKRWPTSEHYFQAQKFAAARDREEIRAVRSPMIAARMGRDFTAPIGAKQRVMIDPHAIHLFDPETQKSITRPTASPEERVPRHVARPLQQA